ncbi:SRPBCC domain-containing protein [Gilvimarinus agarilyticus]|uniref:SRPBCC domain-containing protein n=1 Tax=unclassified Gilvimarinus TaxID=2642066 RepID=UPI001C0A62F3|nr:MULTISPECIES: SRPBCC domain-containing protein [unclassified Gilvimarinus]MBU2886942.1 SRPBCC domain-containing protein [Gilvimarinus agarilyticus]MDO6571602.1 SRPBCC domain-containing protein [Gilvimarinus sp. 2_MG-2023]MDO6747875.1 SRPBCC domain-containing protein [Gilvimarinus sp. 1_MG-2023]
MKILIETLVNAPLSTVWNAWVTPEDITHWNTASDEWCCPSAELDLSQGGRFNYRMQAKDGTAGFDFEGEFTAIIPHQLIRYQLADQRMVEIKFTALKNSVEIIQTFDTEDNHTAEQQKQGWLSILNSFKNYVENKTH